MRFRRKRPPRSISTAYGRLISRSASSAASSNGSCTEHDYRGSHMKTTGGRGYRGMRSAFAALAMIAATLLGARDAAALAVGETVSGNLAVGEKQVPLPQGDWVVAGLGAQTFDMPEVGAFGAIRSVILFQRAGDRIVAMAEINTNAIAVNDGWGRTRSCQRGQQFILVTRYRTGWEMSCFFVQP